MNSRSREEREKRGEKRKTSTMIVERVWISNWSFNHFARYSDILKRTITIFDFPSLFLHPIRLLIRLEHSVQHSFPTIVARDVDGWFVTYLIKFADCSCSIKTNIKIQNISSDTFDNVSRQLESFRNLSSPFPANYSWEIRGSKMSRWI